MAVLACSAGLLTSVACAPVQDETSSNATDTVYRLPWMDASGEYTFQDISLPKFNEPDKLRGLAAEIIVNPRVSNGTLIGEESIGRWIRSGSRMVPADSATLWGATLYAHIEKLSEIDRLAGVSKFITSRERVGLLSLISDGAGSPLVFNNAVYDGKLDSLFIVPYTPSVGLNIAVNGGIIGHEHFHRVFQAIILNPIREAARNGSIPYGWDESIACAGGLAAEGEASIGARPERTGERPILPSPRFAGEAQLIVSTKILNQVLVRAVNEGFADFWGWAYSGDENFVGRSLGKDEDSARRLDQQTWSIPEKESLRNNLVASNGRGFPILKSEAGRVAAAYRFGTEYARMLRGFVDALVESGGEDRTSAKEQIRQALASAMPDISANILNAWGRDEIEVEMLLKPILTKMMVMSATGPAILKASSSEAICGELTRLKASTSLKAGLCGSSL